MVLVDHHRAIGQRARGPFERRDLGPLDIELDQGVKAGRKKLVDRD